MIPPSLNPPSLQAVSPALHQDGLRSGTPTLRTPTTTVHTLTPHNEGEEVNCELWNFVLVFIKMDLDSVLSGLHELNSELWNFGA